MLPAIPAAPVKDFPECVQEIRQVGIREVVWFPAGIPA
jgi:hypothetical protein